MRDPLLARLADAIHDGGIDLVAAFPSVAYDAAGPPPELTAGALLPGARSMIVVGSGGTHLWRRFTDWLAVDPKGRLLAEAHPLDHYVAGVLDRGSAVLADAGVRARRLEPTFLFQPRIDFRRLGALSGLGAPSPIGMVVHPVFGPWWALRGAWLCDRDLVPTPPLSRPCEGCPAPCRAAIPPGSEGTILAATLAARTACVLSAERYSDEQVAYHYTPDEGLRRLAARLEAS
ncbi:MAG: hypothetical protein EXR72_26320 [Myxococcales bacterium]|nr:hypothetical protein [Myxococcales bacterium]